MIYTVVSRKYNLSLSTKRRGSLYVGCDNFSRDYALPSDKADSLGGGVEAKHKASPNASWEMLPTQRGEKAGASVK